VYYRGFSPQLQLAGNFYHVLLILASADDQLPSFATITPANGADMNLQIGRIAQLRSLPPQVPAGLPFSSVGPVEDNGSQTNLAAIAPRESPRSFISGHQRSDQKSTTHFSLNSICPALRAQAPRPAISATTSGKQGIESGPDPNPRAKVGDFTIKSLSKRSDLGVDGFGTGSTLGVDPFD